MVRMRNPSTPFIGAGQRIGGERTMIRTIAVSGPKKGYPLECGHPFIARLKPTAGDSLFCRACDEWSVMV